MLKFLNNNNNNDDDKKKRIIITTGEPAGIGPDLAIIIAQKCWPIELVVCADPIVLQNRAKQLQLPIKLHQYQPNDIPCPRPIKEITVLNIHTEKKVIPGKLDMHNSQYVLKTIERACYGCLNKEFSAMVTGPVNKKIINDAGILFTGHTEYLAQKSKTKHVVMMLVNNKLRIALLTTHLPVSKISESITKQSLNQKIKIINNYLKKYFRISSPAIHVCGLNPHAGEGGHIGTEEIKIIIPTINLLRSQGYNVIGPLAADTLFQKKHFKHADVILAMYHDQGLPIIKHIGFGKSVNITLGLPFIRTSVDHGSAIKLAGTGSQLIQSGSMKTAIKYAIKIINNLK